MNPDFVNDAPLRIAAVGLEHDEIYRVLDRVRSHDTAELVAIAERSGRLRMAAAGRYRVPVFPRLTPLLAETAVDAVIVATANGHKAAVIAEALRACTHVIAHAPFAITAAQLDAVAEAQAASGTALLVLQPLRFTPVCVRLKELLAAGHLGAISQVVIVNAQKVAATPRTQAFYDTRTHGGILTSLAVHDLDVLQWLGGELTLSGASTQCHGITEHADFEDAGTVRCTFVSGGEGVVACNWLVPDAGEPFQELTIIGTKGSAWVSGGKLQAMAGGHVPLAPEESASHVYVATHSDSGRLAPAVAAGQPDCDAVAAMLAAALATLGDAKMRAAATAEAFQTARVAVQAQEMARAGKELP